MSYKYYAGQRVSVKEPTICKAFDLYKLDCVIRGVSSIELPGIGFMWIVECVDDCFPNETYPFNFFCVSETMISL